MEKITLHLKTKELIEELIKEHAEIDVAIKNAIIDKVTKRIMQRDYFYATSVKINEIVKQEVLDTTGHHLNTKTTKLIEEEIKKRFDSIIQETIKEMWMDAIKSNLDKKIAEFTEYIEKVNPEELVKKEIEKQVKARLDRLWRNP